MDIIKSLKTVKNVNDYISVTQNMMNNKSKLAMELNISTVLLLKNFRSLEIKYFNKCYDTGAAIIMFEIILQLPSCVKWEVIGKELVNLIHYWLEALRKHLIDHNMHWWKFMNILLTFIQEIYTKHTSIVNCLVEKVGDCLLDLATRNQPSMDQRQQIVQCFNKFSAVSTRQLRFVMKKKFDTYFPPLTALMANCGDIRVQFTIMETLIRWLLPRQDMTVRMDAANQWFPRNMFSDEAIKTFLEQSWLHFSRDARMFLNAHNETRDDVISILCRKFFVGNVSVISDTHAHWLDINCGSKCITLILDRTLYKALGVPTPATLVICDALVITDDNTTAAKLYRRANETILSVTISDPLQMYALDIFENNYTVNATISSRCNLQRVDKALRDIFNTKYRLLMDIENTELSQRDVTDKRDSSRTLDCVSEEDTRFSNPPEVLRKRQSEHRQLTPLSRHSPSSASTSSLVLLRERLSAFENCIFNKEVEKVSAIPQLQSVTEVTETDEAQSYCSSLSTIKLHNIDRSSTNNKENPPIRNDIRDTTQARKQHNNSPLIDEYTSNQNIVNLLAEEALNNTRFETLERKSQDYNSNDNPCKTKFTKARVYDEIIYKNKHIVCNTSVTDDSSTAFVENTPAVTLRDTHKIYRRILKEKRASKDLTEIEQQTFDNKKVEDFFAQHFSENTYGELIVSPTLARKISDSQLLSNKPFLLCPPTIVETEFNFTEVVECLTAVVDTVCMEFEDCLEQLNQITLSNKDVTGAGLRKLPIREISNPVVINNKKSKKANKQKRLTKGTKLKVINTEKENSNRGKKMNKKTYSKSTCDKESVVGEMEEKNISTETVKEKCDKLETPLSKRRRKLYSLKDNEKPKLGIYVSETEEDNSVFLDVKATNITTTSTADFYKNMEMLHNKSLRQLPHRNNKHVFANNANVNDVFDDIKKTVENEVVLIDRKHFNEKTNVYNFPNESEEDDFKEKKIVSAPKRNKARKTRRSRNKSSIDADSICNSAKRPNAKTTKRVHSELSEMEDERMRKSNMEILNTSLVVESQRDVLVGANEPEPTHKVPRMIPICDEKEYKINTNPVAKKKQRNKNIGSKKEKVVINTKLVDKREKTISPLPGLTIETIKNKVEPNESISTTILDELKNICKGGNFPDFHDEMSNVTTNRKYQNEDASKRVENKRYSNKSSSLESDANEPSSKKIKVVLDRIDIHSSNSLSTQGRCPITAHGNLDESPPDLAELNRNIRQRSLETQDLNECMTSYYNKLTNYLNVSSNNSSELDSNNNNKADNPNVTSIDLTRIIPYSSPTVSISRLSPSEIGKWLPPPRNSVFDSAQTSESETSPRRARSYTRDKANSDHNDMNIDNNEDLDTKMQKGRSMISPIRMFEELNNNQKSRSSEQKNVSVDVCTLKGENSQISLRRYNLRKYTSARSLVAKKMSDLKGDALDKSDKNSEKSVERHSIDESLPSLNVSGPSGSSVEDWLCRNTCGTKTSKVDCSDSLKEILTNIIEKLHTTLKEIHHNTSKSMVNLFVEMQQNNMEEERERLFKLMEKQVLDKFTEFKRRFEEIDEKRMCHFRERASGIIRVDVKQKRDLIKLIEEDIQTVLNQNISNLEIVKIT